VYNIYYKHTHAYKCINSFLAIAAAGSFLYLIYNMYIVTVIVVSQWWSRSVSGDGGGDENC